jgi:ribosomal protein S18 acetylase RimI-like enzyme
VAVWPLPFQFPDHAAYLYNLYVLPSERNTGIGSALALARLQLARRLGFREGWRMVSRSNVPSLRTVRKSGSTRIVGVVRYIKLLNWTYGWFRPPAGLAGELR